jgi:signal transduction histidine kinase
MMPRLSGDQLVRALRELEGMEGVPIVLLSAKADDELRVRLLREGAQDYLMKPFSAEELQARIANLITVKRAREVLQRELTTREEDLDTLAAQIALRNRELQTSLDSLRVARDAATKASFMKTTFLGLVSHELRTPLTALHLQLHRLRKDAQATPSPKQQQLIQRMSAAMTRLNGLVESLLNYAQMQSGRLTMEPETFDLRSLIDQAVEELAEQAQVKKLSIELELPSDLGTLHSDPRMTRLVLVNLLGNAIKFTERGAVVVSGKRDGDRLMVSVRDTGPGISARDQQRIFEPFSQGEDLATKHLPGVGLGLTLVKEMVNSLGGHLHLSSEVGEGTTFTVVWPPDTSP